MAPRTVWWQGGRRVWLQGSHGRAAGKPWRRGREAMATRQGEMAVTKTFSRGKMTPGRRWQQRGGGGGEEMTAKGRYDSARRWRQGQNGGRKEITARTRWRREEGGKEEMAAGEECRQQGDGSSEEMGEEGDGGSKEIARPGGTNFVEEEEAKESR
ncbi:hypothetical protein CBR_g4337 [Chara braunii]|uniref:Uncharacterized protein n=1 Tax=Chara braunii TaxID=69332 RepID=A0A388JRC9_CHABU|nr:hypothetical protein CBR_g4337 [Chara braunii]|eukprot:GBG60379.1 hypothetical protein CBR_g4337 [Chara braunii]